MEKPDKRRTYDAAFRAEELRVVAAAHALNLNSKLLCKWQGDAYPALPAAPAEAAEVQQLHAANRRLAQELEILKKPSPFFRPARQPHELLSIHGAAVRCLSHAAPLPGVKSRPSSILCLAQ